ncbi:NAD(P)/FAD-dependent oxidoreductase [Alteromonas sp. a30]|uniref:NAD(P)/FAD-dependent oxidoreductase n=1 Tax=Alteromonas sp. a30 TaxID=2730917 RepID=UPI002282F597|nr:NAD(P)/FAD-dependent oxidoreductase [Alteromonas sp. a30]MCY7296244.1 NAD(P)/FAD-dependent oxidoreductase [Alteromonas sp. a30]
MKTDVIIIGAGAAGLFCAAEAGKRGRHVLVLDHAKKVGRKILMSGGGRCNFTNMYCSPENFISSNPHFCKSALNQYSQWDFITLVNEYEIPHHEKTLGQLFCDDSAKDIVNLLLNECQKQNVGIQTQTDILSIERENNGFSLKTNRGEMWCESLVVATGGLSMPKLGATPFGYKVAEQFGHNVLPTRAGLVPFTLHDQDKAVLAELTGVAVPVTATCDQISFNESMLFTHRGLSGPSMLQISSYWQPGQTLEIDLNPRHDLATFLQQEQKKSPKAQLINVLTHHYPKRMVQTMLPYLDIVNKPMNQYQGKQLEQIAEKIHQWRIKPNGTEGYRTAEVTLGGVDTDQFSSKTMESKLVPNLFFVGEVLDVTGWLGGYNFQWAWSSGWVAGQNC